MSSYSFDRPIPPTYSFTPPSLPNYTRLDPGFGWNVHKVAAPVFSDIVPYKPLTFSRPENNYPRRDLLPSTPLSRNYTFSYQLPAPTFPDSSYANMLSQHRQIARGFVLKDYEAVIPKFNLENRFDRPRIPRQLYYGNFDRLVHLNLHDSTKFDSMTASTSKALALRESQFPSASRPKAVANIDLKLSTPDGGFRSFKITNMDLNDFKLALSCLDFQDKTVQFRDMSRKVGFPEFPRLEKIPSLKNELNTASYEHRQSIPRNIGSTMVHLVVDGVAECLLTIPQSMEEIGKVVKRFLPDMTKELDSSLMSSPVKNYQQLADRAHNAVDRVFVTNAARLYTPDCKQKMEGKFLVGVLPAPCSTVVPSKQVSQSVNKLAKISEPLKVPIAKGINDINSPLKVGSFSYTNTAAKHFNEFVKKGPNAGRLSRPYMKSQLIIEEIMAASNPVIDPGGIPGALRWDVPGILRGNKGTWELVIHPETNMIYHFNFK